MQELVHLPSQLQPFHQIAGEGQLTPGVAKALAKLPSDRAVTMREFAGTLHCDNSYVTSVIDVLEERGLVERQLHPTDRRVKVLRLTEEGSLLAKKLRHALLQPPQSFRNLSEEETVELRCLLRKLSD